MIRVLIVDSDAAGCAIVSGIVSAAKDLSLSAIATSSAEALLKLNQTALDVVALSVSCPNSDPAEIAREVMRTKPVPIVLYSMGPASPSNSIAEKALCEGAVAYVASVGEDPSAAEKLATMLRLMSEIKLVKRWSRQTALPLSGPSPTMTLPVPGVIAIGASTGGPPVLKTILSALPQSIPVPILAVQHITPGFLPSLIDWLQSTCALPICIATDREPMAAGRIYFAPDGANLGVDVKHRILLDKCPCDNGICPSVSYLFRNVHAAFGAKSACVLLTGMGRDGAHELLDLYRAGALTIVQDKASSAVFGMPSEALRLDAATHVAPPEHIPELLMNWISGLRLSKPHTA